MGKEVVSGLKITIKIGVFIRYTCLSIWISPAISGFPVNMVRKPLSLRLSIGLTIPGFLVGNPGPTIGFPSPFLGVTDIRKPSNLEPCCLGHSDI